MRYGAHFADETSEQQAQPTYRGRRIAGIVAGAILGLGLVTYLVGCVYFSGHLWPNTTAGDVNLSLMTAASAREAVEDEAIDRTIRVTGQGVDETLSSDEAGIKVDANEAVHLMQSEVSVWQWPLRVLQSHDVTSAVETTYDVDELRAAVERMLAPYNAVATEPVNASVGFDVASGTFFVNPGSTGTKLDAEKVTQAVLSALRADSAVATLASDVLVPQTVTADDPSLRAAVAKANDYVRTNVTLTLAGAQVATLNASVVKDWVSFGDDLSVSLSDDAMAAWVDSVEKAVDDVGGTHTYTRPDGKVVTVTGGTYGWISDGEALEEMVEQNVADGFVGTEEIPCKQTAAVYAPGAQEWGPRYIDVDLTEQHLRFYDSDGTLLVESDIISGAPGNDTPTGVYVCNAKGTNVTLVGLPDASGNPSYRTPVSYWMPFVGNAVGLHDATWQPAFGGTLYEQGYGSHGCVNLPYDVAQEIYGLINVGDVVITHN